MKLLCMVIVSSVAMVVVFAAPPNEGSYKVKQKINLDEVLQSDRLLSNYFNCLMEEGQCTAAGLELKRIIPDALKNKCARCSSAQKQSALKAVRFLSKQKPEMWRDLLNKYDPDGKFRANARADPQIEAFHIPF